MDYIYDGRIWGYWNDIVDIFKYNNVLSKTLLAWN